MHLRVLTNSEMKARRRCARYHHLRYNLGYRPLEDGEALTFGTLVHAGLETWWAWHMGATADCDAALEASLWRMRAESSDSFVLARAEALLAGYHVRWADEMARYEVLGVELEFRAPLINPETGAASRTFQLGGKLDALVRERESGRVIIVEHKTASDDVSTGSTYWRRLRLDSQISCYFAGAEAMGFTPAACLYDVLGKPAQRPLAIALVEDGAKVVLDANGARVRTKDGKKWRETGDAALGYIVQTRPETVDEYKERLVAAIATDPDRYYQRGEVVRLEEEIRDHAFDIWAIGRAIADDLRTERAPKNSDSCTAFGRECPYFPVCTGAGSLDDAAFFERVDNVHQELQGDAA